MHVGVYVNHTGPLTWQQRAWAAVLPHWPDDKRVAALGQACQKRRTTATRLLAEAKRRTRVPGRRLILEVLGDIAQGANSALERRYLVDVERAHGLPCGPRQRRVVNGKRTAYRDVDYERYETLVELDGQLGHDGTEERWDDLDRDVDAAVAGKLTVRAGWRQILWPCRLAIAIGRILVARGWDSWLVPCGPDCPVATGGARVSPCAC